MHDESVEMGDSAHLQSVFQATQLHQDAPTAFLHNQKSLEFNHRISKEFNSKNHTVKYRSRLNNTNRAPSPSSSAYSH